MRLLRLEEISGEDAEAGQGRNALRFAVACWVVGYAVFFGFQRTPVVLLAGFLLLGAICMTAKAFYHFAALASLRAPRNVSTSLRHLLFEFTEQRDASSADPPWVERAG